MPVIVIRLLLDMYTRQSTCILWNGSRSTVFDTKNGVRQGGVLSPLLFSVAYPELVSRGVSKSRKFKWLVKVGACKDVNPLI